MTVPSLASVLREGRIAVERHIDAIEGSGGNWQEETASEILWANTSLSVRFASFTRNQESKVGADWLWWWLDAIDECFGMLVQAKRYFKPSNRWTLDFKGGPGGNQLAQLMRSARELEVCPQYVLYRGSRADLAAICGKQHPGDCPFNCEVSTVSVLPALEAEQFSWNGIRSAADLALQTAIPLEYLGDSTTDGGAVYDFHLYGISEELRALLSEPQRGARHVAKEVFRILAEARTRSFSEAAPTLRLAPAGEQIFTELPDDRGHFSDEYYSNVFRGLRRTPPPYVSEFLQTGVRPPGLPESIAGMVVLTF
ncbi:hypothetical protein ACVGVM_24650 [Pseudonocardia bannensis]|uniref:Uncharacterized protein n=1 Tax=Pseudonocardia bannensis TaxID=630973 RepID=A0A848DCW7_9PSEU|nr:hypothetical protein [Pseudonocardia bannensis]NMH90459.1 hypothetical protein [Pseudonocardia bannensis]